MQITATQENARVPVTVLCLDGDLAGDSYDQLIAQARQAITGGAGYILLDMGRVGYMSSAGIRAIHQIFNWLRALPGGEDEEALKTVLKDARYKSHRLKLLNPCDQVQRTLSTAGLDMYIEIHHDRKKALASF